MELVHEPLKCQIIIFSFIMYCLVTETPWLIIKLNVWNKVKYYVLTIVNNCVQVDCSFYIFLLLSKLSVIDGIHNRFNFFGIFNRCVFANI